MLKKHLFLLPIVCVLFSCNEGTGERIEDEADTLANQVENAVENVGDEFEEFKDETFVDNVCEENAEVLRLTELAMQKGSARTKEVAGKLQSEHKNLGEKLRAYAGRNQIECVSDDDDNLETISLGANWDEEWSREIREETEDLLDKFQRKNNNANDPALQEIVSSTIPVLQQNLSTVENL